MKRYLKSLFIFLFIFQWFWFLLFAAVFSKQPRQLTDLIVNDQPTAFVEARNYFTDLTDFALQGEYLYVLYEDVAVLEVYTLDGDYIRSYACPWSQNGASELLVVDDQLWLIDRRLNRFLFRDGLFVEAAPDREYSEYSALKDAAKTRQEARRSTDGTVYTRKGTSIFRNVLGGSEVVVKRPFYDILMQGAVPLIQHFVVLFLMGGMSIYEKKSVKTSGKKADNGL